MSVSRYRIFIFHFFHMSSAIPEAEMKAAEVLLEELTAAEVLLEEPGSASPIFPGSPVTSPVSPSWTFLGEDTEPESEAAEAHNKAEKEQTIAEPKAISTNKSNFFNNMFISKIMNTRSHKCVVKQ